LGPPPGTLVLAAIMVSITCVSKPLRVGAIEWANLRHGPAKRRAVRLGGQLVQGHRCHVCDHAPGLPDNCHRLPRAPLVHPPAKTELARWPQVETANANPSPGRQVHRGLIRSCREARTRCCENSTLMERDASCFDFSKRTSFRWFACRSRQCQSATKPNSAFVARQLSGDPSK
jgi:hypothetical protein